MAGKVTIGLTSYWPCVTGFSGLSVYRLSGLQEGDEHPADTTLRSMASFTFTPLILKHDCVTRSPVDVNQGNQSPLIHYGTSPTHELSLCQLSNAIIQVCTTQCPTVPF